MGVGDLLELLERAEPDHRYIDNFLSDDPVVWGADVPWRIDSDYVVEVPVERVLFMEDNLWNLDHAAALKEVMDASGSPGFRLPAARLYRIDADRVASAQRYYDEGELEYQRGMVEPWDDDDEGGFYVHLLDGNHRALAAMAAGEPSIFVTVGPNYREDVLEDEWVRPGA